MVLATSAGEVGLTGWEVLGRPELPAELDKRRICWCLWKEMVGMCPDERSDKWLAKSLSGMGEVREVVLVIEGVFQTLIQRQKDYWLTCHRVKVEKS